MYNGYVSMYNEITPLKRKGIKMAKKITKAELAEAKAERDQKRAVARAQGVRVAFILGFAGNLGSAIMYSLLIETPETGMYVLACVNIVTAAYFLYKAIQ